MANIYGRKTDQLEITQDLDMNSHNFKEVSDAQQADQVYNKAQVDNLIAQIIGGSATPLSLNSINDGNELNGNIDLTLTGNPANFKLLLENPTQNNHASNKGYVDTQVTALNNQIIDIQADILALDSQVTAIDNKTLDQIKKPVANIDMNGYQIKNVQDPVNQQDAGTKAYIDQFDGQLQSQINNLTADLTQETLDRIAGDQALQSQVTTNTNNIATNTTNIASLSSNKRDKADSLATIQSQSPALTDIDLGSTSSIISSKTITQQNQLVTKSYTDTADSALQSQITTNAGNITTLTNRPLNQVPIPTGQLDLNNQNIINGNNATFNTFYGDHSGIHYGTSYSSFPGSSNALHVDQQNLSGQLLTLEMAIDSYVNNELAKKVNLWTSLADTETGGSLLFESTGTQRGKNRIWNLEAITPSNYDTGNARYKSQPLTCDALQYWPINRLLTATADYSMGNFKITNLGNPTQNQDASTKFYVDNYFPTKIQNSAIKSKLDCSGDNAIDIYVNNAKLGTFYQPVGQASTPLGLSSLDKIQFQSGLNSISVYGSKSIDTNPLVLNTNGFYITSNDNQTANVQNIIGLSSQYSPNVYLASGHINTTKYAILSTDCPTGVQLCGATDSTTNPYIQIYPTSASQTVPIKFSGKTGYVTTTSITDANQFASKAYVDSTAGSSVGLVEIVSLNANSGVNAASYFTNTQFNQRVVQTSTLISYNTSTGYVTLQAGTYRMNLHVTNRGASSSSGYYVAEIRNTATSQPLFTDLYSYDASFSQCTAITQTWTATNSTEPNGENWIFQLSSARTIGLYCVARSGIAISDILVSWSIQAVNVVGTANNTSSLIANSNIDLATAGYRLQTSAPTNSFDATTKAYVDSQIALCYSSTVTLQYIQNLNPFSLDMGSNRLATSYVPTLGSDVINKTYFDANIGSGGSFISSGNNRAELVSVDNFRIRNTSQSSPAITVNLTSFLLEENISDRYIYDVNTASIMQRFSNSANTLFQCRPIAIQASSSTTRNACLYIDRTSGSQFTGKTYALQVLDNAQLSNGCYFDAFCQFVKPTDFTTMTSQKMSINQSNNALYSATNALSVGFLAGGNNNQTVASFAGNVESYNFVTIVPISQREFKKNIILSDLDDLENVNLYQFEYDKEKLYAQTDGQYHEIIDNLPDDQQYGFIVDSQLPERYIKESRIPNVKTIDNANRLKDHLLQFLLQERRSMKAQLLDQETRLKRLEDIILLGQ